MPYPTGTTNSETEKLIVELRKSDYKQLANQLKKSARARKPVNLSRISRMKEDTFAIPGKVLSLGTLDRSVNVYALSFSAAAKKKIISANGKALPLKALLKDKAKARMVM